MKSPIIVISSPRSGSSTLAGILHHLGVDMGEHYVRPDMGNPTGYFEDAEIVHNDMKNYEDDREEWEKNFRELVKDRKHPWGFKTPTLCATIREVREILEEEYNPTYIYLKRNLRDTAKALESHHNLKNARQHVRNQQDNIKANLPKDTLTIKFEDLTTHPKETIAQLIHILELKPTKEQQMKAFLQVIPPKCEGRIEAIASKYV